MTEIQRKEVAGGTTLAAVSYNIRHGVGMDGRLSLKRVAGLLGSLQPDIVGLVEVDRHCRRSGGGDQAAELGRALGMHAAFGKFMDLEGGQYGMAILSRYPIGEVAEIPLSPGSEPRVALMAEIQLPTGKRLRAVNVHFDWVEDDRVRFTQARELREFLRTVDEPIVLMGDFNDRPGSRTLSLFADYQEAAKPPEARLTYPADEPEREIDFIFVAPVGAWSVGAARVLPEKVVSDHRPVVAELTLRGRF